MLCLAKTAPSCLPCCESSLIDVLQLDGRSAYAH